MSRPGRMSNVAWWPGLQLNFFRGGTAGARSIFTFRDAAMGGRNSCKYRNKNNRQQNNSTQLESATSATTKMKNPFQINIDTWANQISNLNRNLFTLIYNQGIKTTTFSHNLFLLKTHFSIELNDELFQGFVFFSKCLPFYCFFYRVKQMEVAGWMF